MRFLKENYNHDNIIYKYLDLDQARITVIFKVFFIFSSLNSLFTSTKKRYLSLLSSEYTIRSL